MYSHTPLVLEQRKELHFVFDGAPEYWCGDDVVLTHFFNALSMIGPEAERFLIRVIRKLKDKVSDKKLLDDCDGFIRQEAMHSRIHTDFNQYVASFGYDMQKIEAAISGSFDSIMSRDPCLQLDVVRAAEHLIYEISMLIVRDKRLENMMAPAVGRLLRWHAMEEIEHCSVAHDLYVYLYGESYLGRMKGFMLGGKLLADLTRKIYDLLMEKSIAEGVIAKEQSLRGWASLWVPPYGMLSQLLMNSVGYAKPNFRPWHNFERDMPLMKSIESQLRASNPELLSHN